MVVQDLNFQTYFEFLNKIANKDTLKPHINDDSPSDQQIKKYFVVIRKFITH